jgi:hypothetical protein
MVLIDTPRKKDKGCHMVATSILELHEFAIGIGVKRWYYENKRGKKRPHYDIKGSTIQKAIDAGAILVERRELLKFLKEHYG